MASGSYATQGASDNRFDSGTAGAAVSENEDLANFISMITRAETPFMSSIGKTKATGIYHEWQTDELNAPADSTMKQGADFDNVGPDGATDAADGGNTISSRNRTRLGNYTQINGKTVSVSGTKRAVDQTGVADEYAYQLKKRGTELRRDVESDMIHSTNIAIPGASGTKGKMGAVMSWMNTAANTVLATGSTFQVPSTLPTGAGTDGTGAHRIGLTAATDTRVALELSYVDQAMENIYEAGGKATRAMMSPKNRRVFSSKAQAANSNVRRNIDEGGKLRASVDVYMSDFGDIMIEPNYIMGLAKNSSLRVGNHASNVQNGAMANLMILVYDPQWFKSATLRPLKEVDVGQKGDSTVGMIVEECTLECSNPSGSAMILGLNGA
jgi:hypothetical protein